MNGTHVSYIFRFMVSPSEFVSTIRLAVKKLFCPIRYHGMPLKVLHFKNLRYSCLELVNFKRL